MKSQAKPKRNFKIISAVVIISLIAFIQISMLVQLLREGEPLPFYLAAFILEVIGLLRVVWLRLVAFYQYYDKATPNPKAALQ